MKPRARLGPLTPRWRPKLEPYWAERRSCRMEPPSYTCCGTLTCTQRIESKSYGTRSTRRVRLGAIKALDSPTVFALHPEHHVLLAHLTGLREPRLGGKPFDTTQQSSLFIHRDADRCTGMSRCRRTTMYLCVTARPMSLRTACGELRCTAILSGQRRREEGIIVLS